MCQFYNNPKVSIVVPIYNVGLYIGKCAESLFRQTYDNIEYVFVDDCTPDNSIIVLKKILDLFPQRKTQTRIICHDSNKGLSCARETGIQNSTGDFIIHVDGDDFVDEEMVELCIRKTLQDSSDIVIFGTKQEYKDKSCDDYRACEELSIESYLSQMIQQNIPSNIWGKMYKLSLYKDNDIHCIPHIGYGEDFAVLPKLLGKAKKVSFLKKTLYHYVHYNTMSFTNSFKWKNLNELMIVERGLRGYFRNNPKMSSDLDISHLKWTAWALRNVCVAGLNIDDALKMLNYPKVNVRDLKGFSANHKIILFCYKMKWFRLLVIYVKVSKSIFGGLVRKK